MSTSLPFDDKREVRLFFILCARNNNRDVTIGTAPNEGCRLCGRAKYCCHGRIVGTVQDLDLVLTTITAETVAAVRESFGCVLLLVTEFLRVVGPDILKRL